jgi:hypothetical protein
MKIHPKSKNECLLCQGEGKKHTELPHEQDITPAGKYRTILLAQISLCCVVINRCSTRYSSIFRLA